MKLYTYKAKLLRVVDGDTIDVMIDLGFDTFRKIRVRMLGYNAPEIWRASGEELEKGLTAKKYLQEQFDKYGYDLIVESQSYDRYGRTLAYVTSTDGNVNYNYLLEQFVKTLEKED